jgi:hypothetical protein
MHESSGHDPDYPVDECGSYTTLRPVYADEAAACIDRIFGPIAGSPHPTPRPADPRPGSTEPASLLDDLRGMGWFED